MCSTTTTHTHTHTHTRARAHTHTSLTLTTPQADASIKAGKWDRNTYVGTSLTGKTIAIIGFGKVRRACVCAHACMH